MVYIEVGFTAIQMGISMGVYHITPNDTLSLDEVQQMVHILRTQLLEPIQIDHEDFRFYSTQEELQNMFGEAANVELSKNIERYGMDDAIHFIGSDRQDLVFGVWIEEEQQNGFIELREEGSMYRLVQLFHDGHVM